ncbi:MAG: hypothetical protein ACI4IX_05315 [Acutalibacteraceae bacterium]
MKVQKDRQTWVYNRNENKASPAADAQRQLQDALNFEGNDEEKKVKMYLNTLGIDYDSLTKEELVTQINILKKSKHMKSPYSKRGKARKRRK